MNNFLNRFQKYNIPLITNGVKLPVFVPTDEQKREIGVNLNCSNSDFLFKLCKIGFDNKILNKIPKEKHQEYMERLEYEFNSIESMGFVDYILMIWDICYFGDKVGIPRGPGRGSVCSSLLCFLIGITEIDAVKHGTFFSRFLNKARAKVKIIDGVKYVDGSLAPDIDQDQCFFRRHEIIDYINGRYSGKTCKLLTTTTFSSKILIKDVYKSYENASEEDANYVSNLLEKKFGVPEEIKTALETNEEFKKWAAKHKDVVDISLSLYGETRGAGQHASAILVSADPIGDIMPLQLSKDKEIISGYDMYVAQELFLKIDELGLKTVSHIDAICKLVGIKRQDIDINDQSIYDYFQDFEHPHGIFQFETEAQYNVAKKIKPKKFKEVVDALSISRPGASSFLEQYVDYIHNGVYKPISPLIDDVLKETGGVCLFQENLLKMLNNLGMDMENCELLRKAIGKKQTDKIKEYKQKIYDICEKNSHPKEVADLIWKIAEDSSGYQFNLAHATSYGSITCICTYLKVKYPKEFFLTLLRMSNEESDKHEIIAKIKKEMEFFGIRLLSPHILRSSIDYSIEGNDIRIGLSAIKGISEKSIEKLNKFRTTGQTDKFSTFQAANEAKLPLNILSAIILTGALDDQLTQTRAKTFMEACLFSLLTSKEKNWAKTLGPEYNYDLISIVKALNEKLKNEKGQPVIKDSRRATIRKHFAPYQKIYEYNKKNEKLCAFICERFLLGFSYTTNLYEIFSPVVEGLYTIFTVGGFPDGEEVRVVGEVVEAKLGKSKEKKTPYLKLDIKDHTGNLRVMAFDTDRSKTIEECKLSNGRLPKEGDVVVVRGIKKDGNCIFARAIGIQKTDIFLRVSELPEPEKDKNE